jgi:hypothetical protein
MKRAFLKMGLVFALWLLFLLSLLPAFAVGEVQIITQTVRQTFGGGQSPDDARIAAVAKAKREALEKAGTYIEHLTVVKTVHPVLAYFLSIRSATDMIYQTSNSNLQAENRA